MIYKSAPDGHLSQPAKVNGSLWIQCAMRVLWKDVLQHPLACKTITFMDRLWASKNLSEQRPTSRTLLCQDLLSVLGVDQERNSLTQTCQIDVPHGCSAFPPSDPLGGPVLAIIVADQKKLKDSPSRRLTGAGKRQRWGPHGATKLNTAWQFHSVHRM